MKNIIGVSKTKKKHHVAIIGGGFTGIAAAYELASKGIRVTVLEKEKEIGGLSSGFLLNGTPLEKFYHFWFTGDRHILNLAQELDIRDKITGSRGRTGIYYDGNIYRFSSPLDLLKFTPLNFLDRVKLGVQVLKSHVINSWEELDPVTIKEWFSRIGGDEIYRVVWSPLLEGKFGKFAPEISAAWLWNKFERRGKSRNGGGVEKYFYYEGGFPAFLDEVAAKIKKYGGEIRTGSPVISIEVEDGEVSSVRTQNDLIKTDAVIMTAALPIIANIVEPHVRSEYVESLRRIKFLANICLILELEKNLSDIFWLNINDPGYNFVGVIEHTNFISPEIYGGRHIVYLTKYLDETDRFYKMEDIEIKEIFISDLKKIFKDLRDEMILNSYVFRSRYAQPVAVRNYSKMIPSIRTPIKGLYISTMAQIYPEDRGTNSPVRDGRKVAREVISDLINGNKTSPLL
ncbi:MAG: NAD(P)/FAD-dependent oxidoreductase [Candidatus Eremiobacteraeota bacterium]|nr:NAD(P)/FAD-dependent oxidoreductase [Candidatus Eremiobacteraeota bacterium]